MNVRRRATRGNRDLLRSFRFHSQRRVLITIRKSWVCVGECVCMQEWEGEKVQGKGRERERREGETREEREILSSQASVYAISMYGTLHKSTLQS